MHETPFVVGPVLMHLRLSEPLAGFSGYGREECVVMERNGKGMKEKSEKQWASGEGRE